MMRLRFATGMALVLVVLGIVLAVLLERRVLTMRSTRNTADQWKLYQNDFLNFRIAYPPAWRIDDAGANTRSIRSLVDAKTLSAKAQAGKDASTAIGIGTVTFSPLVYSEERCSAKRLFDCPGFQSTHAAVITLRVFYEPLETTAKGVAKRHNPYEALDDRICSFSMKAGISRDDIDHVFSLCADWKDGQLTQAQQEVIKKQYQELFQDFYQSFQYLRNPTITK